MGECDRTRSSTRSPPAPPPAPPPALRPLPRLLLRPLPRLLLRPLLRPLLLCSSACSACSSGAWLCSSLPWLCASSTGDERTRASPTRQRQGRMRRICSASHGRRSHSDGVRRSPGIAALIFARSVRAALNNALASPHARSVGFRAAAGTSRAPHPATRAGACPPPHLARHQARGLRTGWPRASSKQPGGKGQQRR